MLHKQFVAWNCNSCTIAPLTDYISNPIYQEIFDVDTYFSSSEKRIYRDLRDSMGYTNEMKKLTRNDSELLLKVELKILLAKKMRLTVWRYTMSRYLYMLAESELTLEYKTHSIVLQENNLERWENNISIREFDNLKKKRKQKGGFVVAIAAPIAAQVGTQLIGGLVNKIFRDRGRKIRFQITRRGKIKRR